jgi:hypothetical protein
VPVDVRINEVTADVSVADPSAMLTPEVLDRIVRAVLVRLEEQQRNEREVAQERSVGARSRE